MPELRAQTLELFFSCATRDKREKVILAEEEKRRWGDESKYLVKRTTIEY